MWKLFGYGSSQGEPKDHNPSTEDNIQQYKNQIENKLIQLQRLYQQSQSYFEQHYLNKEPDEILTTTFEQLIATIEGLIALVLHLRTQYEQIKDLLYEHHQLKQMMSNHQDIVSAIQDSHSQQVASIYQQKSQIEKQLRQQIAELSETIENINRKLESAENKLSQKESQNLQLRSILANFEIEATALKKRVEQAEIKYRAIVELEDPPEIKKFVDLEHIKLDYVFYYGKMRQNIIAFFDVKDLVRLQQVSKFYQLTLKKQQPRNFYLTLKRQFQNQLTRQIQDAKTYQKIYELFPSENIKSNAMKYLYFKIKPAAYILPYLQEQPYEQPKQEQQEKQKTTPKFNWKSLFNSDKTIKSQKKEDNKFTLSALRNEEEFKRTEARIQALFKNILPIKMPEDLIYFSQTMQSQLQELKGQLSHNKGKGTQAEWTAQIFCLSRYMYHEINELYSLLQVIFGELIVKNKELMVLRESYQYMRENQLVLRNLIENISSDKANIEKKLLVIENDILKTKLQRQAVSNACDRLTFENASLKRRLESLEAQHATCKQTIGNFQSQHKLWEHNLARIREEIEIIENSSGRIRKSSFGSVNSQQQAGQEAIS